MRGELKRTLDIPWENPLEAALMLGLDPQQAATLDNEQLLAAANVLFDKRERTLKNASALRKWRRYLKPGTKILVKRESWNRRALVPSIWTISRISEENQVVPAEDTMGMLGYPPYFIDPHDIVGIITE